MDTPMDPSTNLISDLGEFLIDHGRHRKLVVKLNYLRITPPDITFIVSVIILFLKSPCDSNWNIVIHILQYIKISLEKGLLYEKKEHIYFIWYYDVDWPWPPTDRWFTSSYFGLIKGDLISWSLYAHTVYMWACTVETKFSRIEDGRSWTDEVSL